MAGKAGPLPLFWDTKLCAMRIAFLLICLNSHTLLVAQTVARQWNEALMSAIRIDKARPTVQARNLFHLSIAMYDAWAAYDDLASTYALPEFHVPVPADLDAARNEAISFAAFRLLNHRFRNSVGAEESLANFRLLLGTLGYDESVTSIDYTTGSAAALGNYIAQKIIEYGLNDGSNEENDYANQFYQPVNPPLVPDLPGNPGMKDCNRWQPLKLNVFIDQGGIPQGNLPPFLSPEWGSVRPFALKPEDLTKYVKEGHQYHVYYDPGPPPMLDSVNDSGLSEEFKWGFSLVSIWASHLDQGDGVMIDISPASIGNIPPSAYPRTIQGLRGFYNLTEGGDIGHGYSVNPKTGLPYQPQIVPRGDYTRVLAEFWADGPNSETPPGHWFTILNYVNDHPLLVKRLGGQGQVLDDLEWEVKAYLALGGAVHDAAISAWGIKGYYDSVRPISAIRYLAEKGQSTNRLLRRYHPAGFPLRQGFIELVKQGDPLAGAHGEHINKIKLYTWRGYLYDPVAAQKGVGWILAETWFPYQRPTFVTPPFAGYISGHSTYSSAGAQVLTLLTGDEYFPGGLGEFPAKKDEFLVFEQGPSVDVTLQWARYKDAADQCSLSRIWGGIHPPADDIPGRLIGEKIGLEAFTQAVKYFRGEVTGISDEQHEPMSFAAYPNPVSPGRKLIIELRNTHAHYEYGLTDVLGKIQCRGHGSSDESSHIEINLASVSEGIYILKVVTAQGSYSEKIIVQ